MSMESKEGLSPLALILTSQLASMKYCGMWRKHLSGVFGFTVSVLAHYLRQQEVVASPSDNPVHEIQLVGISAGLFLVHLQE